MVSTPHTQYSTAPDTRRRATQLRTNAHSTDHVRSMQEKAPDQPTRKNCSDEPASVVVSDGVTSSAQPTELHIQSDATRTKDLGSSADTLLSDTEMKSEGGDAVGLSAWKPANVNGATTPSTTEDAQVRNGCTPALSIVAVRSACVTAHCTSTPHDRPPGVPCACSQMEETDLGMVSCTRAVSSVKAASDDTAVSPDTSKAPGATESTPDDAAAPMPSIKETPPAAERRTSPASATEAVRVPLASA